MSTLIGTLPTSLQPVCLSRCHPALGRWPQCLPESRSLWSPLPAGGSAAAAFQRCPYQRTDSLWNEPQSPWACRGWSTRCWRLTKQGLWHIARAYITFYSLQYLSLSQYRGKDDFDVISELKMLITSVLWGKTFPLSQGLCWKLKDFQWKLGKK